MTSDPALITQLVEWQSYELQVEGSSPSKSTKIKLTPSNSIINLYETNVNCPAGIPERSKGRVLRSRASASWVRIPLPAFNQIEIQQPTK